MPPKKVTASPTWPGAPTSPGDPVPIQFLVDVYIRVSTDRQAKEGDSLEEQESELKKFCDYRGFQIRKIFVERGRSGGNTNRPEYQNLIKDIESGKIKAVVVKKLDRLSRSLLDFEALMLKMQDHDVEFMSLRENFDTTTAMGKAMLRVALVFAQLEREQSSERTSDVMTYRASLGLHNGGISPFGYTNVSKELVLVKKEKEIVELIFKSFIELQSTQEVAKRLSQLGVKTRNNFEWDAKRVQKLLINPLYQGQVLWKGVCYAGMHAPLVSEETFDRVQEILKRKGSNKESQSLFKKFLTCGSCLSPMTTSHALNQSKKKFFYYRCMSTKTSKKSKCTLKQVSRPKTDQRILEALAELTKPLHLKPIENQIIQHNQTIQKEEALLTKTVQTLESQISAIKAKQNQYMDALMSQPFLSEERKRFNDRLSELDRELKQLQNTLHKARLALTSKTEERLDFLTIKKNLIQLKSDEAELPKNLLRDQLHQILRKVICYTDCLSIQLKDYPWPIQVKG